MRRNTLKRFLKRKKVKNTLVLWFVLATAALAAFGVLAQLLCEGMGYDRSVLGCVGNLISSALVFCLLYYAAVHRHRARFLHVLVPIVLLLSAFQLIVVADRHLQKDAAVMTYRYGRVDQQEEVQYMLGKSRIIGHGIRYFEYSDAVVRGFDPDREDFPETARRAFDERARAEAVFGEYREVRTLPVLSYSYGLWVSGLYALLAGAWCVVAGVVSLLVHGKERVAYIICYLTITVQLVLLLLGAFGLLYVEVSVSGIMVSAQVGIMTALVKTSRPRHRMQTVPDDFWNENLDEE